MSWLSLVDLFAFLFIATLIFIFFNHHHGIRIAVCLSIYILCYLVVFVAYTVVEHEALTITLKVFEYSTIFIIVSIVVVYQNDFKILFAKIARGAEKGYAITATDEALVNAAHEMVVACQNMSKDSV